MIQLDDDVETTALPPADVPAETERPQNPIEKSPPQRLAAWGGDNMQEPSSAVARNSDLAASSSKPAESGSGTVPMTIFLMSGGRIKKSEWSGTDFEALQALYVDVFYPPDAKGVSAWPPGYVDAHNSTTPPP